MEMVKLMRIRNVKNKEEILNASSYLITEPKQYFGKWNELFGNNNSIHVEIGTGKGNFIINKALTNPDINFIGIEKFDSILAKCLQKIPEGLENLKIVRMNALEIEAVFNYEIDTIYLNFSDPWQKKRWHKRRLTSKIFLEKYDSLFANRKRIVQKTDNKDLFEDYYFLKGLWYLKYPQNNDYDTKDAEIAFEEYIKICSEDTSIAEYNLLNCRFNTIINKSQFP
mgnify:CR=1 FL=1